MMLSDVKTQNRHFVFVSSKLLANNKTANNFFATFPAHLVAVVPIILVLMFFFFLKAKNNRLIIDKVNTNCSNNVK